MLNSAIALLLEICLPRYALLLGSAPEGFRQKKLEDMWISLESSGRYAPGNILAFPNGVNELFLESVLRETIDKLCDAENEDNDGNGGLFLHLCTKSEADLHAELTDSAIPGVEVVRLGKNEIRKEVIAYYADLAEKLDVGFEVEYALDGVFESEKSLGWEVLGMNQLAE